MWSVLVVDDNPVVRELICELFTREADFQVVAEADNGRDALAKAQEFEPDLIVTDLSMPQMNGLEETRALKKAMPLLPVIESQIGDVPAIGYLRCALDSTKRPAHHRGSRR